jgi:iron complex transport system ATP-binding protein
VPAPRRAREAAGVRAVVELAGVRVVRDGVPILDGIDWTVQPGERWVVLGPNGSGKTTLLLVAAARLVPTAGRVRLLGAELGRADWRTVRARIGLTSGALARRIRPGLGALEVVLTGRDGTLEPWWGRHGDADRRRAAQLLAEVGLPGIGTRPFGVCSDGERQLVLLARELMGRPHLLVLDEPFAGLDLAHREELLDRLDAIGERPGAPPLVLVTHHLEEIPCRMTHALLLRGGRVAAAGPVAEVLTGANLSRAYGLDLEAGREGGRWWARRAGGGAGRSDGAARGHERPRPLSLGE